jgi:hypothetical protein
MFCDPSLIFIFIKNNNNKLGKIQSVTILERSREFDIWPLTLLMAREFPSYGFPTVGILSPVTSCTET